jgi:arsenite methyltransferase
VRDKYKDVATNPRGTFHFHTGRPLAELLGYDSAVVDAMPDRAFESFAGVGNPHSLRPAVAGDRVVDLGSGGGFDCFVAAQAVGPSGAVIGVDMTPEMLTKARETASELGFGNVEFRAGILEDLPVDDGWADPVISNGVINLCADKTAVFAQAYRALKPGGVIQFADIANGVPLPEQAVCSIDLWTGCIAGGQPVDGWRPARSCRLHGHLRRPCSRRLWWFGRGEECPSLRRVRPRVSGYQEGSKVLSLGTGSAV